MALSINTQSKEVAHFLEENAIHKYINNTTIDVIDVNPEPRIKVQPNLDLMFMLPNGPEMQVYDRVTLDSFNSETTTLKIECLIPSNKLEFLATTKYYSMIVKNAIDLASDYFSFQRIKFQRDEYINLIDMLEKTSSDSAVSAEQSTHEG